MKELERLITYCLIGMLVVYSISNTTQLDKEETRTIECKKAQR